MVVPLDVGVRWLPRKKKQTELQRLVRLVLVSEQRTDNKREACSKRRGEVETGDD